jgi:hypothetical protein
MDLQDHIHKHVKSSDYSWLVVLMKRVPEMEMHCFLPFQLLILLQCASTPHLYMLRVILGKEYFYFLWMRANAEWMVFPGDGHNQLL